MRPVPSPFRARPPVPHDRCEHCAAAVHRVWLVPGDVLNSCADCYRQAAGRDPVHEQGHSTAAWHPAPRPGRRPAFSARPRVRVP